MSNLTLAESHIHILIRISSLLQLTSPPLMTTFPSSNVDLVPSSASVEASPEQTASTLFKVIHPDRPSSSILPDLPSQDRDSIRAIIIQMDPPALKLSDQCLHSTSSISTHSSTQSSELIQINQPNQSSQPCQPDRIPAHVVIPDDHHDDNDVTSNSSSLPLTKPIRPPSQHLTPQAAPINRIQSKRGHTTTSPRTAATNRARFASLYPFSSSSFLTGPASSSSSSTAVAAASSSGQRIESPSFFRRMLTTLPTPAPLTSPSVQTDFMSPELDDSMKGESPIMTKENDNEEEGEGKGQEGRELQVHILDNSHTVESLTLLELPDEILLSILLHLPPTPSQLLLISSICTQFHILCHSPILWQRIFYSTPGFRLNAEALERGVVSTFAPPGVWRDEQWLWDAQRESKDGHEKVDGNPKFSMFPSKTTNDQDDSNSPVTPRHSSTKHSTPSKTLSTAKVTSSPLTLPIPNVSNEASQIPSTLGKWSREEIPIHYPTIYRSRLNLFNRILPSVEPSHKTLSHTSRNLSQYENNHGFSSSHPSDPAHLPEWPYVDHAAILLADMFPSHYPGAYYIGSDPLEEDETHTENLRGHKSTVYCVETCEDWLISGSRDKTIRFWKMKEIPLNLSYDKRIKSTKSWGKLGSEKEKRDLILTIDNAHQGSVLALQLDACDLERDGKGLLVSASSDGTAKVWEIDWTPIANHIMKYDQFLKDVPSNLNISSELDSSTKNNNKSISTDDKRPADAVLGNMDRSNVQGNSQSEMNGLEKNNMMGQKGNEKKVMEIKHLATLRGHVGTVLDVALSSEKIITCGKDTTLRIYSRQSFEVLHIITCHTGPINCLSLSPTQHDDQSNPYSSPNLNVDSDDNSSCDQNISSNPTSSRQEQIITASSDGTWAIINLSTYTILYHHRPRSPRGLACVDWNSDHVVFGDNDGRISIYQLDSDLTNHSIDVDRMKNGSQDATGISPDIRVKSVRTISAHKGLVRTISVNVENGVICSGGYDGALRTFDLNTGVEHKKEWMDGVVFDLSWSVNRVIW
ncbi:hypothetical protein M231_07711 [Tremella mesenterica]|uniref:F-box domain-containing protein n=1 Tax=Tremella mesenterica TaxID=5217 RepID=A0A4Q1BFN4_TREME|nr:hypothetical protein M231_07711 [Tremella mesenterica]